MKRALPVIALAVFAGVGLATPLLSQEKGGEKLAASRTPGISSPAPAAKMNCATETRSTIDPSARGAFKKPVTYTAHLCASCENKETAKGAGKLAVRKVEHSCTTKTACCSGANR